MLLSNYSQPVCPLNSLKKPENKNHQSHHIWPHKWSLVLWDQKEVVKICSSTLCKVCHLSDLFWPEFGFLAHHLKQGFCAWVKKMCLTVFPWNICVRHIDPMQVYSKEGVTLFNNLCDLKNSYLWDELVILGLGWNCSLYFRMRRVTFLAVLKHSPSPPPLLMIFFQQKCLQKMYTDFINCLSQMTSLAPSDITDPSAWLWNVIPWFATWPPSLLDLPMLLIQENESSSRKVKRLDRQIGCVSWHVGLGPGKPTFISLLSRDAHWGGTTSITHHPLPQFIFQGVVRIQCELRGGGGYRQCWLSNISKHKHWLGSRELVIPTPTPKPGCNPQLQGPSLGGKHFFSIVRY